jgi:uncharacterized damage-inducible protein DinB
LLKGFCSLLTIKNMPLAASTLVRLQTQHQTLDTLLPGLSLAQMEQRTNPEKWSIHENIAHLGRYQEIFFERIQLIRQGDTPSFARYTAETDVEFPAWQNSALPDILEQIQILRRDIYQLIARLDEDELSYIGIHPKYGLMNISAWTEFFLLHEAHHLLSIFGLVREIKMLADTGGY